MFILTCKLQSNYPSYIQVQTQQHVFNAQITFSGKCIETTTANPSHNQVFFQQNAIMCRLNKVLVNFDLHTTEYQTT